MNNEMKRKLSQLNKGIRFTESSLNASRQAIRGSNVFLTAIQLPPMVILSRNINGEITSVKGYLADIWHLIEKELNFRTVYVDPVPPYVGESKNGVWDGLIGALQFKNANVGLASLGISLDRKRVVDFSAPIDFDSSKLLMFSNKKIESVDWTIYLTAFSWQIWVCVLALWVAFSITLSRISKRDTKMSKFVLKDYLFYLFGVIVQQGSEVVPRCLKGRLMLISFWAMSLVLYTSFTAILTTKLTTAHSKPISSLQEALSLGLQVSVVRGTFHHQQILGAAADNVEFKEISKQFKKNKDLIVPSVEEGIKSTMDGKTLFFCDSSILEYETKENCSFEILSPSFSPGYLHLAYNKEFQFQDLLDKSIIRLMTSGVQKKLSKKWLHSETVCNDLQTGAPTLGLQKMLFGFMVILGGVLTSFLLFLFEFSRKNNEKIGLNNLSKRNSLVEKREMSVFIYKY